MPPACPSTPYFPQNKPPRESIFCGKVGDWRKKSQP